MAQTGSCSTCSSSSEDGSTAGSSSTIAFTAAGTDSCRSFAVDVEEEEDDYVEAAAFASFAVDVDEEEDDDYQWRSAGQSFWSSFTNIVG